MARILIAEDEDAVRRSVERALAEAGHVTRAARDGAEALDILSREESFDLLLTDIKMPIMDGIALALAAAPAHPGMKILLMTGYADQRERAHGLEGLINDMLSKPFTLAQLHEAVNAALALRR